MPASSRRKGVRAEREVAAIWQAAGFEVRGLEGAGDHLVIIRPRILSGAHAEPTRVRDGLTIHSEVKRQERLKLPEWLRQAADEAPQGTVPVVAFRQSRQEWYACLRLADLVELAQ
jgi:Holliday junction resolvase